MSYFLYLFFQDHPRVINKSRYGSIDSFLSRCPTLKPEFNDLDLIYDEEVLEMLKEGGVDDILARHLAHLFIRDPLVSGKGQEGREKKKKKKRQKRKMFCFVFIYFCCRLFMTIK